MMRSREDGDDNDNAEPLTSDRSLRLLLPLLLAAASAAAVPWQRPTRNCGTNMRRITVKPTKPSQQLRRLLAQLPPNGSLRWRRTCSAAPDSSNSSAMNVSQLSGACDDARCVCERANHQAGQHPALTDSLPVANCCAALLNSDCIGTAQGATTPLSRSRSTISSSLIWESTR